MGANTRDAPVVTGLILARRRRRVGTVDLLVKSNPGDAAPAVYGDLYFDTPAAGGNYVLTALGGAYTVTGGAAVIKRDRNMTASGGSYAVTGSSAIVEKDRRLTASGGSYAVTGGDASITLTPSQTTRNGGFEMGGPTPRKVYVKRGKRIHIFDTVEDADEWLEAEDKARQVVNAAKPKPQAKAKVFKALDEAVPHDVVRLDVVRSMVDYLGIPVEMPTLEARQDWAEVARVALMARQMQDEEDIELLLAA